MYNPDQFTHKQIKVRRPFMKVCEWLGPGYTSINSGKNAFNPYNSVTKYFFFSFVLKIYYPQYAHIHSIDVRVVKPKIEMLINHPIIV